MINATEWIDQLLAEKNITPLKEEKLIQMEPNFQTIDGFVTYFYSLIEINSKKFEFHYAYNQFGYTKALQVLYTQIDNLYSERITYNEALKTYLHETLIPYYRGRFTINMSREISFLPLELRIYIYTELLKKETVFYNQAALLDRLSLTLYKAHYYKAGSVAVALSAWNNYNVDQHLKQTSSNYYFKIRKELKRVTKSTDLREEILNQAEMTPEIAGREFYYGIKGFTNLESIHNFAAAPLCFEAFSIYFKPNFKIIEELHEPIFKQFQTKKGNLQLVEQLKQMRLDEVEVATTYYTDGNPVSPDLITEQVNQLQEKEIRRRFGTEKSDQANYLNANRNLPIWEEKEEDFPPHINFKERLGFYLKVQFILGSRTIHVNDFNRIITSGVRAMFRGEGWELRNLSLETHLLLNLEKYVLLREDAQVEMAFLLVQTLIKIAEETIELDNNQQWPIGMYHHPADGSLTVAYSSKTDTLLYWGETYFYSGMNNEKALMDGQYISTNLELIDIQSFSRSDKKIWTKKTRELFKYREQYCRAQKGLIK
ncbi:hypothetical protein [Carnobacterium inhibens]|uniref:hypothetical protein n=1 Tax=Carnobacterium inhibens TaxID=147709 RepID=UPI00054D5FA7|nr:hypothetical protein [Carnobacterium inhibens]